MGVGTLTLYAFSSDNWRRPPAEVAALMGLLKFYLANEVASLKRNGIRLSWIGRRDRLPDGIAAAMQRAEFATAGGRALHLRIAVDYSARVAILHACCAGCRDGRTDPRDVSPGWSPARQGCVMSTSSSGPVASSDCPISCYGRVPTQNCISPNACGRILERTILQRPWRRSGNANAGLVGCQQSFPSRVCSKIKALAEGAGPLDGRAGSTEDGKLTVPTLNPFPLSHIPGFPRTRGHRTRVPPRQLPPEPRRNANTGASMASSVNWNVPKCMPRLRRGRMSRCARTASDGSTWFRRMNHRGSYAPIGSSARSIRGNPAANLREVRAIAGIPGEVHSRSIRPRPRTRPTASDRGHAASAPKNAAPAHK